jgi:hypothetical protein
MNNKHSLSNRAMLSTLSISVWTARKLDRKVTNEVNADHGATQDAGRYNKLLLNKAALADITRIANEARGLHYHFTLPWIDAGPRIIAAPLFMDYRAKLRKLENEFFAVLSRFVASYPDFIAARQVELNGLFNPADYPAPSRIAEYFAFTVNVLPLPDVQDFRIDLPADIEQDLRRDIEKSLVDASQLALKEAAERIREVVGHLADKLTAYKPASDTSKAEGIFRDSLIENAKELAAILPGLNIAQDGRIDTAAQRLVAALAGLDAGQLRDDAAARRHVATEARAILADVDSIL